MLTDRLPDPSPSLRGSGGFSMTQRQRLDRRQQIHRSRGAGDRGLRKAVAAQCLRDALAARHRRRLLQAADVGRRQARAEMTDRVKTGPHRNQRARQRGKASKMPPVQTCRAAGIDMGPLHHGPASSQRCGQPLTSARSPNQNDRTALDLRERWQGQKPLAVVAGSRAGGDNTVSSERGRRPRPRGQHTHAPRKAQSGPEAKGRGHGRRAQKNHCVRASGGFESSKRGGGVLRRTDAAPRQRHDLEPARRQRSCKGAGTANGPGQNNTDALRGDHPLKLPTIPHWRAMKAAVARIMAALTRLAIGVLPAVRSCTSLYAPPRDDHTPRPRRA